MRACGFFVRSLFASKMILVCLYLSLDGRPTIPWTVSSLDEIGNFLVGAKI